MFLEQYGIPSTYLECVPTQCIGAGVVFVIIIERYSKISKWGKEKKIYLRRKNIFKDLTREESVNIYTAREWINWWIEQLSFRSEDQVFFFVMTSAQWICSGSIPLISGSFDSMIFDHRAKEEKRCSNVWLGLFNHIHIHLLFWDLSVSEYC